MEANKDRPFFLYLPHTMLHNPLGVSEEFKDSSQLGRYGDAIQELDHNVGRIFDSLRRLGIANHTIVVYASDNGRGPGRNPNQPIRGHKLSTYEGGIRVPCIAWGPGLSLRLQHESSEVVRAMDWYPTLASFAGVKVPEDRVIDGRDISPLLFAESGAKSPHEVLFYEVEGVRRGKWKLVQLPKDKSELYNLEADLGETKDLSDQFPDLVNELKSLLEQHAAVLKKNRRPAAFVQDPKPLLPSSAGVPTLREYLKQMERRP